MLKDSRIRVNDTVAEARNSEVAPGLHPAWEQFIRFCEELRFGELENVKIQDGLPVLVEVTTKKVRFAS